MIALDFELFLELINLALKTSVDQKETKKRISENTCIKLVLLKDGGDLC